jgi:hypothetical protein
MGKEERLNLKTSNLDCFKFQLQKMEKNLERNVLSFSGKQHPVRERPSFRRKNAKRKLVLAFSSRGPSEAVELSCVWLKSRDYCSVY